MVTQPDKPKGRGNTMQFPPVKECAVSHGLEVFQPVKNPGRCKCGIFEKVCAGYHHSGGFRADSSKEFLDLPKYGCLMYMHPCFQNIVVPHRSSGRSSMEMRSREFDYAHGCRTGYRRYHCQKNRCALQKMRQVEVCLTSWRQSAPSCVWKPCRCWKTKRRPLHRRTMRRVPTQR